VRRYYLIFFGLLVFFLVLFLGAEALNVPILTDPQPVLGEQTAVAAAVIGISLLVVDALLPVPSSLVMLAHGALFGPVVGALLSLAGRTGFAVAGYAIGRRGGAAAARHLKPEEREHAQSLLERWGLLAVVFTRPVPMVAESVSIMAGMSPLGLGPVVAASMLGSLPEAVLYAVAGSIAPNFQNAAFIWLFLLAITIPVFLVARFRHRGAAQEAPDA
jgi:uncharacterized membrane protein YdjX (TVP38/TMEM64 family)